MSEAVPGSVEIGDSVLYQTVGEDVVLLNLTSQEYFGLDSIGAAVWQLIMEHGDVEAAVKKLVTVYAVDEHTARSDIHQLISDLIATRLLKITPSLKI